MYKSAHPTLVSACAHESLSNLSCVGCEQDGTGGAAVQSSDRERAGEGDRLLKTCLAQQLTSEHIYFTHFGMQKCDIFISLSTILNLQQTRYIQLKY